MYSKVHGKNDAGRKIAVLKRAALMQKKRVDATSLMEQTTVAVKGLWLYIGRDVSTWGKKVVVSIFIIISNLRFLN